LNAEDDWLVWDCPPFSQAMYFVETSVGCIWSYVDASKVGFGFLCVVIIVVG
jgi:hypothetical protein